MEEDLENQEHSAVALPQRAKKSRRKDDEENDNNNTTVGIAAAAAEEEEDNSKEKSTCVVDVASALIAGEDPPQKYEYQDHTADIQFHSWGKDLAEAFEQVIVCMFGYITELETVEFDPTMELQVSVEGHDLESLLYNYMDEFLFLFCTEKKVAKRVRITNFDKENFKISAVGVGELFDLQKHPQGADIKAITYSAMQIIDGAEKADVYVIVDI